MDAPIGIRTRQDRTPGRFRIDQSRFSTAEAIAEKLSSDGSAWYIQSNYIGGQGEVTQAIEHDTRRAISLYRDSRDGWWLQKVIGGKLLVDLDATMALAQQPQHRKPYAVAEQGMGHWTMHLFRDAEQFKSWCKSGREGIRHQSIVPLGRVHGRRDGIVDHAVEE